MRRIWKCSTAVILGCVLAGMGIVPGVTASAEETAQVSETEYATFNSADEETNPANAEIDSADGESNPVNAEIDSVDEETNPANAEIDSVNEETSLQAAADAEQVIAGDGAEPALSLSGADETSEPALSGSVGDDTVSGVSESGEPALTVSGEENPDDDPTAGEETTPDDGEGASLQTDPSEARICLVVNGLPDEMQDCVSVSLQDPQAGEPVTVTAAEAEGYYLAQIRLAYCASDNDATMTYQTLEVADGTASFVMPEENVTVYADYISVVWDGTVDLTWYDTESSVFEIRYPAQFEGAAVLCAGLFNDMPTREVTIDNKTISIPDLTDESGEAVGFTTEPNTKKIHGIVTSADGSGYQVFSDLDGDGRDTTIVGDLKLIDTYNGLSDTTGSNNVVSSNNYWFGGEDFYGKTLKLTADLDMGGVCQGLKTVFSNWTGPNYMPLGGGYSMDPDNGYTRISAGFNGTLDGQGYMVDNIYAARHVTTGFGNCEGCGLVGMLGAYRVEYGTQGMPAVKNIAVDGFIYGNRMVGGIVGKTYHSKGLKVENCINFATVYNTDAKGCGGIVGNGIFDTKFGDKQPVISNCVNFGFVCTGYNKNAGGLVGYSEATTFDSYTLGFVAGEGYRNGEAAQAFGANNAGALWYNCYALAGGSTTTRNQPGVCTPLVWDGSVGSAMRQMDSPDDYKTAVFLSLMNGKVKNNGPDDNGYMDSDDDVIPNVRRNFVRGEATADNRFVSDRIENAMKSVVSWHDPNVDLVETGLDKTAAQIAGALTAVDVTGMPVPYTFLEKIPAVTDIVRTGTPRTDYLTEELFETGNHEIQSQSPEDPNDAEFAIWAIYDDGSYRQIEDYDVTYENGDHFCLGDTKVTVSAQEQGVARFWEIPVTVEEAELLSFEVTALPTCLLYAKDEYFLPDGITVKMTYGKETEEGAEVRKTIKFTRKGALWNGYLCTETQDNQGRFQEVRTQLTEEAAAAYAFSFAPTPDAKLTADVTEVTISHSYGDKTMSAAIPVTVLASEMPKVVKDGENNISTVTIKSENDFTWFANQIATKTQPTMHAVLESDLDLSDLEYPVGIRKASATSYQSVVYLGTFEGNGHTIQLEQEASGTGNGALGGLFYDIGSGAAVNNLCITGSVKAASDAGSVSARLSGGSITGCRNQAEVISTDGSAGGMTGFSQTADSMIAGCINEAAVSGAKYIGGIAGLFSGMDSEMANCRNLAAVSDTSESDAIESAVGGLVGSFGAGIVHTSQNHGAVSGMHMVSAAGIAGKADGTSAVISDCLNTGNVTVTDLAAVKGANSKGTGDKGGAGGVFGRSIAGVMVQNCYTSGKVTAEDPNACTGAFAGQAADLKNMSGNYVLEGSAGQTVGTQSRSGEPADEQVNTVSAGALRTAYDAAYAADETMKWEACADDAHTSETVRIYHDAAAGDAGDYDEVTYCRKCSTELARESVTVTDPSDPDPEDPSDPGTTDPSDPGTTGPANPGTTDAETKDPVKPVTVPKKKISACKISGIVTKTYTGKALKQKLVIKNGSVQLKEGTDYKVTYSNNTKAGTATVVIKGIGTRYDGTAKKTFVIKKAAQPMTVKTKTASVSRAKVAKKKQTIKKTKAFTIKKNQGKVTFKKIKGSKQITINSAGTVSVKKGTKKGTYKIWVKVTATGTANYKSGSKSVILTIKVK